MAFVNTEAALVQVGGLVTRRLAQGLQENAAIASGDLEKSITFRAYQNNAILGLEILMLDYWQYVDEGRKAGRMPPVSKIQEWLTYPNVREKLQQNSDKEFSNIESKAFAIAKKIGEKGTKGTDFATNVFESTLVTKEMPQLIEDAIGQDLEDVLDKAFNIE
jgi:hypothetical protein